MANVFFEFWSFFNNWKCLKVYTALIGLLRASEEHIDRNSDFPEVAHDFYFPPNQLNSIYCKLQQYIGFKVTNFHFSDRSSHQRCSIKKGVLRNFAKFTGKHLCQSLFFNKVASGACNFLRTPFSQNTSGRLPF